MISARLLISLLLLTGVGCAGHDDGSADLPDPNGDVMAYMQSHGRLIPDSDAERTEKAASFQILHSNEAGVRGPNLSTHFCALSAVKGNFNQRDQMVRLSFFINDDWHLKDNDAFGAATCTAWSNFLRPAGSVNWLSEESLHVLFDSGKESGSIWFGDAATVLTDVTGEFEDGGEYVRINQSSSATSPSTITVRTDEGDDPFTDTTIRGGARSVFVGVPASGRLVKLWGWRDGGFARGDLSLSGIWRFDVGADAGFSSYWLPGFNDAFCYLARVSGDMSSDNAGVEIIQKGTQWFLQRNGDGRGWAYCMAYDQR